MKQHNFWSKKVYLCYMCLTALNINFCHEYVSVQNAISTFKVSDQNKHLIISHAHGHRTTSLKLKKKKKGSDCNSLLSHHLFNNCFLSAYYVL